MEERGDILAYDVWFPLKGYQIMMHWDLSAHNTNIKLIGL